MALISGFRPIEEIKLFLASIPELRAIIGHQETEIFLKLSEDNSELSKTELQKIFTHLMSRGRDEVKKNIEELVTRLNSGISDLSHLSPFLVACINEVYRDFGGDIGICCMFFMNVLSLAPGEGIFMSANEPHAYLKGDCIECMARSDNVVRAGLTPKLIDVPTLTRMLTYKTGKPTVYRGKPLYQNLVLEYRPPVEEFVLLRYELGKEDDKHTLVTSGPSILLVLEGDGEAFINENENSHLSFGSTLFLYPNVTVNILNLSNRLVFFICYYEIKKQ